MKDLLLFNLDNAMFYGALQSRQGVNGSSANWHKLVPRIILITVVAILLSGCSSTGDTLDFIAAMVSIAVES